MARSARSRVRPRKVVDEATFVSCVTGHGIIREEVWVDGSGAVAKYNLAFINHFLFSQDNGRVLGYDSSHGGHHRHFKGKVTFLVFEKYEVLLEQFLAEVAGLRRETL